MRGLSKGVEIRQYEKIGDWFHCQIAIDGVLSPTWQFPASHLEQFKTEEAVNGFLERSAKSMIERYGDARNQRPEASNDALMSQVA